MTVLNLVVTAEADDGYWAPSYPYFDSTNSLYFGNNSGFSGPMHTFIAVAGAGAMGGQTINAATATVRANSNLSGTTVNLLIYMEDADQAAAPTSVATANALALTSASVAWSPGSFVNGTSYTTPDFASVCQEVADRPSFNDKIQVLIKDNSSSTNAHRRCHDYSTTAPTVDITYTAAAAGNPHYYYRQQNMIAG